MTQQPLIYDGDALKTGKKRHEETSLARKGMGRKHTK
jgi:hypothetical protein